jgi:SAM-dependent methyltransferase
MMVALGSASIPTLRKYQTKLYLISHLLYTASMNTSSVFDTHSDTYDQWFPAHELLYNAELKAIRSLLPKTGESLEIGVGSGMFAAPLGIRIGVEPSEEMAEKARNRGVQVIQGVAENLPFSNHQFDFVLMVTTICFVRDIKQSLREARRVLKPQGTIILGFVDRESEMGRDYLARKQESIFYKDATFYATKEVLDLLHSAGFVHAETIQTLFPEAPIDAIRQGYGEGSFVVISADAESETSPI